MHICIIGTGASGWITAFSLKNVKKIKKITIVGSPSIPTIGVGESTTNMFYNFVDELFDNDADFYKFLVDIDASIKYGVFYKDWARKNFLHAFTGSYANNNHGALLGKLPLSCNENHYMMPMYDEIMNENGFNLNQAVQNYTFHFDANKFILAMEELATKEEKIHHIKDTVIDSKFGENDLIEKVILKNNGTIIADYFVSCIGQTAFNQKILKEEYIDYSNILLTDKALFYPLPYTNKSKEFHPYTVAKTMKYGWRWITPTWSRIGTGYAFSSKYVSTEEAIEELKQDIGDDTIEPFVTDFWPRKIKKSFKVNHCSIGMAAGFLEPLDAPGLSMTFYAISILKQFLFCNMPLDIANYSYDDEYNFWASFILHQYKTSERNDTKFWSDHRNVHFKEYSNRLKLLSNFDIEIPCLRKEDHMFYHTTAGKGHRWKTNLILGEPSKPQSLDKKSDEFKEQMYNHFDFFNKLHKHFSLKS